MCDDLYCPNREKQLCSCKAIKTSDVGEMMDYLFQNVRDLRFGLNYRTLDEPEQRVFRILGACKNCGGELCCCMRVDPVGGEELMDWVYSAVKNSCELTMADVRESEFVRLFVEVFDEKDRDYAAAWLFERIHRDAMQWRKIYTIVRTGCDADHGSFPEPSAEGSFLAENVAIKELNRLISEEKKTASPRFDHEERGTTWWEMNEDSEAALHFTRLEIVESRLDTHEK